MEELVKFYKSLLETFDLEVNEVGGIFVKIGDEKFPFIVDGLPAYLPTDANIRTSTEMKDGQPTLVKHLFNPFKEDAIKGGNKSFLKLKKTIELKLLTVIYNMGEVLFSEMNSEDGVDDMQLVKFITEITKNKTANVKKMIDDKVISNWVSHFEHIVNNDNNNAYIKFFIKRGGKVNDIKYNRLGTVASPFLELLEEYSPKNGTFLGVKLRNKDIVIYRTLFNYLLGDVLTKKYGSINKVSPSSHTLLLMYADIYAHLSPIITSLLKLNLDEDIATSLSLKPLPIDSSMIGDFIDSMKANISLIPDASTPNSNMQQVVTTNNVTTSNTGNPWDKLKTARQPVTTVNPIQVQQQQTVRTVNPVTSSNPWDKLRSNATQTAPVTRQVRLPQQQQSNPWGNTTNVNNNPWGNNMSNNNQTVTNPIRVIRQTNPWG